MTLSAIPTKTAAARELLRGSRSALSPALRMLLINVDGQRDVTALLSIARKLNLGSSALEELQQQGLIAGLAAASSRPVTPVARAARTPATTALSAADHLQRLMRAKMFAFDLACRMLAGRDGELRASARAVDSESRFLEWLGDAAARIEAASDAERAQLFRDRVAQAAA